jgi:intraflagellar transport protein 52
LAQLTNKCENKDLEYFVREAGDMLGVSDKVKKRSEPKAIIRYLLEQIINYKKSNPN